MKFHLDDNELATCVSCGLCLPHCPTFRATGEEALSPRGRIAAIRAVHHDDAPVTPEFVSFMESCVQCRGCEPACPSGVHYGNLQEGVRETLAQRHRITPRWQRAAFAVLPRHRLLLAGSSALAVAQRMHLVPRRAGLTTLAVRRPQPLRATGTDVWLFTGCVMDAWMRDTHRSTAKVLDHLGVTFALPGKGGGCCGALHTHAGLTDAARHLAANVMSSMPGDAPIVVNSAGCGAALKEYGHLLGTPDAAVFGARVLDVHEFVAQHVDRLRPTRRVGPVIVQDPCHLRHVQKAHMAVRTVLAPVADLVELDDDGLCCGAGGAYSVMEPALAGQIRERKLASIARAGGGLVASANPGCAMHLAAAGLTVRHPIDILAEAL
ncbi:MAG: 4Fe-4S dicluster domain-containing protein [Ilumatobacteraceae bacterium]|nr:4Fe-4S dicluster domain-containing protein [Acidimicrobiaceae bacterium]MBP6489158.1 4Fe-4S dicluster domain-containing protein [Ilumatobacteraceae bacterium]MBP7889652.1 4Fe-4S dicluster domain-containing protein [Ilumatobacteraceae bacterium]MBP8209727.1 4Fe-4S dicluster domain-containing protein [Ilumatobacteraceae bacterium]MBP9053650.1 4Fe-4S dicluster domain-containing protein [Ilumatobacteraceae bacterium]